MTTKSKIVSHEAAHILVAYRLNIPFQFAEVLSDSREDGTKAFVRFDKAKISDYEGFLIACAGTVWHNAKLGTNDPLRGYDQELAEDCAKSLGKTVDELYPKAQGQILKILERNWRLMDYITDRLYSTNRIEYKDLTRHDEFLNQQY